MEKELLDVHVPLLRRTIEGMQGEYSDQGIPGDSWVVPR